MNKFEIRKRLNLPSTYPCEHMCLTKQLDDYTIVFKPLTCTTVRVSVARNGELLDVTWIGVRTLNSWKIHEFIATTINASQKRESWLDKVMRWFRC